MAFFLRLIFPAYFITSPINLTGNRRFVNLLKSKQKYKPISTPRVILNREHNGLRVVSFNYISCEANISSCKKPFGHPGNFVSL